MVIPSNNFQSIQMYFRARSYLLLSLICSLTTFSLLPLAQFIHLWGLQVLQLPKYSLYTVYIRFICICFGTLEFPYIKDLPTGGKIVCACANNPREQKALEADLRVQHNARKKHLWKKVKHRRIISTLLGCLFRYEKSINLAIFLAQVGDCEMTHTSD